MSCPDGLYRLTSRSFVAGLVVERGKVVDCAPILRAWALGRPLVDVIGEASSRGILVEHSAARDRERERRLEGSTEGGLHWRGRWVEHGD